MRRRDPIVVTALVICLTLSGSLTPAFAGGLIPTERLLEPAATGAVAAESRLQRQDLEAALVSAGVDNAFARQRLDVLSDAEIARLAQDLHAAPAGGVWFMPFLVVAAVIGVLISTRRSADPSGKPATTDLFGRPRSMATAP